MDTGRVPRGDADEAADSLCEDSPLQPTDVTTIATKSPPSRPEVVIEMGTSGPLTGSQQVGVATRVIGTINDIQISWILLKKFEHWLNASSVSS